MVTLVTGANGFLGSHLVELLVERGEEVRALVRETSDLSWLDGVRDEVELAFGDVATGEGLEEAARDVAVCHHVAGVTNADPHVYERVNAGGTRNVLDACAAVGDDPVVVLVSSAAAGGPGRGTEPISEAMDPRPVTPYGASKLEAERIALERDDLPVVAVRPAAIYGPRDTELHRLFAACSRGIRPSFGWFGERVANFGHARDIARCCIAAAEAGEEVAGEVFYAGGPEEIPPAEASRRIATVLDRWTVPLPIPIPLAWVAAAAGSLWSRITGSRPAMNLTRYPELVARNWALDLSKARERLGWEPEIGFDEGAEETAAWYREQGWI